VVITLKVDTSSYDRLVARGQVKRGDLLGFSPYFDGQVVLSPIDGTIEHITYSREERALIVSIRLISRQPQAAHP